MNELLADQQSGDPDAWPRPCDNLNSLLCRDTHYKTPAIGNAIPIRCRCGVKIYLIITYRIVNFFSKNATMCRFLTSKTCSTPEALHNSVGRAMASEGQT